MNIEQATTRQHRQNASNTTIEEPMLGPTLARLLETQDRESDLEIEFATQISNLTDKLETRIGDLTQVLDHQTILPLEKKVLHENKWIDIAINKNYDLTTTINGNEKTSYGRIILKYNPLHRSIEVKLRRYGNLLELDDDAIGVYGLCASFFGPIGMVITGIAISRMTGIPELGFYSGLVSIVPIVVVPYAIGTSSYSMINSKINGKVIWQEKYTDLKELADKRPDAYKATVARLKQLPEMVDKAREQYFSERNAKIEEKRKLVELLLDTNDQGRTR